MPVKRALYKMPLTEHGVPAWPCPVCGSGYLSLKAGTFHYGETRESRQASNRPDWHYPFDVRLRFSALLECCNVLCAEIVTIAGHGYIALEDLSCYDSDSETTYYHQEEVLKFFPNYINPSPPLINVPGNCDESVRNELAKAFIAFWGDLSSTANHIHSAVERLLDYLQEEQITSLHQRILNLGKRDQELCQSLLAVKWLGNVGSHSDDISRDDVCDALDIIEIVLYDLFVYHREKIKKLIEAINERKGSART